jgi:hypothetical protein
VFSLFNAHHKKFFWFPAHAPLRVEENPFKKYMVIVHMNIGLKLNKPGVQSVIDAAVSGRANPISALIQTSNFVFNNGKN